MFDGLQKPLECGQAGIVIGLVGHFGYGFGIDDFAVGVDHKSSASQQLEFFDQHTPVVSETAVLIVAAAAEIRNALGTTKAIRGKRQIETHGDRMNLVAPTLQSHVGRGSGPSFRPGFDSSRASNGRKLDQTPTTQFPCTQPHFRCDCRSDLVPCSPTEGFTKSYDLAREALRMPSYAHRTGCRANEHPNLGRRSLIQAGGLALLGTGLEDLLRLEAQAATDKSSAAPRAKSVIFIFQSGGASQLETWDPKPEAPVEVRGEYGTTATKLPGFHICEHLPQLAARTHLYSVVRSMANPADRKFRNEHGAASYMLHTGKCELPVGETTNSIQIQRPRRFEWPSIGSMLAYALPPAKQSGLPAVIDMPRKPRKSRAAGKGPGVLGPKYSRWEVDLAPPCHAKDSGGSCPHCFSHDQPDDPKRAPGKGPKAWYDNSSCRDPSFKLPDLQIPARSIDFEIE